MDREKGGYNRAPDVLNPSKNRRALDLVADLVLPREMGSSRDSRRAGASRILEKLSFASAMRG